MVFTDYEGKKVLPCMIADKPEPINSTTTVIPVTNATSTQTIHHFASADPATCTRAVSAAWTAFQTWKRSPVALRRKILLKAADLVDARRQSLIDIQLNETSCPKVWAETNVTLAAGHFRELASCISTAIKGEMPPIDKPDTLSFVYKEAVGPVLIIPPWNGALVLAGRAVGSALAAGCTVVLKASELSPGCHHALADVLREAGLPAGALNVVCAARERAGEVTEAMIGDRRIRKVEFIGSAAVGRKIAECAARYLKPVLMELGGKCPAIVLEDADLDRAARLCGMGAVLHHGQICFSTERIIVRKEVREEFLKKLAAVVKGATGLTAVSEGIAKHAVDVLQDAKDKGLEFLVGGPEWDGKNGVKPSLVLVDKDASPDDVRIVDEETFGPSASVYIVDTDEKAVEVANRSAYGLNATIHTRDLARGIKMGRELEYGQVHINSISVFATLTGPQGGRAGKASGWGRQNALYGLNEYLDEKFISWHEKD